MSTAQNDVNYDESKIPPYSLPDALFFKDGSRVQTAEDWKKRRIEILSDFEEHVYGKTPAGTPPELHFSVRKEDTEFLNGKAKLREIRIWFKSGEEGPHLDLLLITPQKATNTPDSGFPTFLGLNFYGNHSIHTSDKISITQSWIRDSSKDRDQGLSKDNRATEKSRGRNERRWPIEKIIDSGMALAVWYYGDIDPDFDDGFSNGIHQLYGKPAANEWGSIGAWAWGCSRAMDCLEKLPEIDSERVAVIGHSRLGKTALWAGAQDQRFSLVISNNSGCGGAALSRRRFGEKVKRINTSFPHWFCDNFQQYNDKEYELPVDQHLLIALIAPRPVYIGSAVEDRWADPKGEFLSGLHADPVYRLLGKTGLGPVSQQPGIEQPVGEYIRYHLRNGAHDLLDYDWNQYIRTMSELLVD